MNDLDSNCACCRNDSYSGRIINTSFRPCNIVIIFFNCHVWLKENKPLLGRRDGCQLRHSVPVFSLYATAIALTLDNNSNLTERAVLNFLELRTVYVIHMRSELQGHTLLFDLNLAAHFISLSPDIKTIKYASYRTAISFRQQVNMEITQSKQLNSLQCTYINDCKVLIRMFGILINNGVIQPAVLTICTCRSLPLCCLRVEIKPFLVTKT